MFESKIKLQKTPLLFVVLFKAYKNGKQLFLKMKISQGRRGQKSAKKESRVI